MVEELNTKEDLLNKLRSYRTAPDDDNILYKRKIKKALLSNPCLLYALNESNLYKELFDPSDKAHWEYDKERKMYVPTDDCRINWEWNDELNDYEPLGEWDRYFGSDSNIRPFLFIPDTQTEVKHYICYQTFFNESPRYNAIEKYAQITFTIFVHGNDRMDKSTGIPRHDLIASILRERINWTNIFGTHCELVSNRESTTDNNYLVRTLVFQLTALKNISQTQNNKSCVINNKVRM